MQEESRIMEEGSVSSRRFGKDNRWETTPHGLEELFIVEGVSTFLHGISSEFTRTPSISVAIRALPDWLLRTVCSSCGHANKIADTKEAVFYWPISLC